MKKSIVILLVVMGAFSAFSQENMVSLYGGYSMIDIEDSDSKGTGYRISGVYEFNPMMDIFSHGVGFGFISVSGDRTVLGVDITSRVNSFPIYYAPKVLFGNEKIKGYVKGVLGFQFASLNRQGNVEVTDNDFGFYGGGGAGATFFITEQIFINAEYEIAWLSNHWYVDGLMQSFMGGIGYKF